MKIIISCMDRRLNEYLDSLNDGKTIFLRNAGANVSALRRSILSLLEEQNINEIKVITHTDCGAMKSVAKALSGEIKLSELADEVLISNFKGRRFNDEMELEAYNTKLQEASISELAKARGISYSVEMLDISKIKVPNEEGVHKFALLEPSTFKYSSFIKSSEMFSTYIIQSKGLEDKLVDLEVATKVLNLSSGEIVAFGSSEYRLAEVELNRLKLNPMFNNISITTRRL